MPKLAHVMEAMNQKNTLEYIITRLSEIYREEFQESREKHDQLVEMLESKIRESTKIVTSAVHGVPKSIPKTDLDPVLNAVKSIDLTPILDEMRKSFSSIPKAEKVDFGPFVNQIIQRIDHLAMKIDAIEMELPEIYVNVPKTEKAVVVEKEEQKKEYDMTVTARNAGGGIKSVRIKEV